MICSRRDTAVGIRDAVRKLPCKHSTKIEACIGGARIKDDLVRNLIAPHHQIHANNLQKRIQSKCSVVTGTPGRVLGLLTAQGHEFASIRTILLVEADKLFSEAFREDLLNILLHLPARRQLVSLSETAPDAIESQMTNPLVRNSDLQATTIHVR